MAPLTVYGLAGPARKHPANIRTRSKIRSITCRSGLTPGSRGHRTAPVYDSSHERQHECDERINALIDEIKINLLAFSTERDNPLRLGHAPHAFARSVVLDPQVDGFGLVAQQCGGSLELLKPCDAGEHRD